MSEMDIYPSLTQIVDELPKRRLSDINVHHEDGGCIGLDIVNLRFQKGDERMTRIENKLDINSSDMSEVLEILRLGKSFFKMIGIFGALVKWATAIGAPVIVFYYTLKGGGKQ